MSRRMRQRRSAMEAKWATAYDGPEPEDDQDPGTSDDEWPQDDDNERLQHDQQ